MSVHCDLYSLSHFSDDDCGDECFKEAQRYCEEKDAGGEHAEIVCDDPHHDKSCESRKKRCLDDCEFFQHDENGYGEQKRPEHPERPVHRFRRKYHPYPFVMRRPEILQEDLIPRKFGNDDPDCCKQYRQNCFLQPIHTVTSTTVLSFQIP